MESEDLGIIEIEDRRYVPFKLYTQIKRETFDTPENRFAKSFLRELIKWVKIILERRPFEERLGKEVLRDIEDFGNILQYYDNSDIFQEVSDSYSIPYRSQVLYKREGYRELFNLWKDFRSYHPFIDFISQVISHRDLPSLYEVWCLFKLLESIMNLYKEKPNYSIEYRGGGSLKIDVYGEADLENPIDKMTLEYQREFSKPRSYSLTFKPDYSLYISSDGVDRLVGVFDAKFKFELPPEDIKGEDEYELDVKRIDIHKMHTYRDALRIDFAIVIYPGEKSKLYWASSKDKKVEENKFENFDKALRDILENNFEGVGYLPLKPSIDV